MTAAPFDHGTTTGFRKSERVLRFLAQTDERTQFFYVDVTKTADPFQPIPLHHRFHIEFHGTRVTQDIASVIRFVFRLDCKIGNYLRIGLLVSVQRCSHI